MNQHRAAYLGGRLPAYDGRKSLYTAGPLPFASKEFQITLLDDDGGSGTQRSAISRSVFIASLVCMCSVFLNLAFFFHLTQATEEF